MTFSSDAESWELDFHHALACSLIGGNGVRKASASDTDINWIFPMVVNLAGGGAAYHYWWEGYWTSAVPMLRGSPRIQVVMGSVLLAQMK